LESLGCDRTLLAQLSSQAMCSSARYNKNDMINDWMKMCRSALDLEMRLPCRRGKTRSRQVYGRLDKLHFPAAVVDTIRRARGKLFTHGSGYEEWPGSLNADGELDGRMGRRLKEIEASRSAALYKFNGVQTASYDGET